MAKCKALTGSAVKGLITAAAAGRLHVMESLGELAVVTQGRAGSPRGGMSLECWHRSANAHC